MMNVYQSSSFSFPHQIPQIQLRHQYSAFQPYYQNFTLLSIFTNYESVITQNFLLTYKVSSCIKLPCPNSTYCFYYHSYTDRRRPLFYNNELGYSSIICPLVLQGLICPKGDQCMYSHNNNESFYHPANYKTVLCSQDQVCLRELCPFAHFPEELREPSLTQSYIVKIPLESMPNAFEKEMPAALDAELETFKTKLCIYQGQHNQKQCSFYHSAKDRRRSPGTYSSERCEAYDKGDCILKDSCNKSHSMVERLYHSDKYKTKYCNNYPNLLPNCEYGSYCCFAHSDKELRVELIHYYERDEDFYLFHFKTGWCPFNYEHNKAMCVYAHNWQDFRRKPRLFKYTNQMCPNWKSETFIVEYKEGCIYEHNCAYCHGWKEQFYHPLNYKTMPCLDIKKCLRSVECPYYHSEADRRHPTVNLRLKPRKYEQNSVLTITNNINVQKEHELQKMKMTNTSGKEISRRFSEETHYNSLTTTPIPTNSSIKHRASYDFTPEAKRVSTTSSLVHIQEESPGLNKEDNLFEIFQSQENESISLFFSPMSVKVAEGHEGHKSCPVTPLVKVQSKGFSVFKQLRLNEVNPEEDKKELEEFFQSIELKELAHKFLERKVMMHDLLSMSQEDFKEMDIQPEVIRLIMGKVKESLERRLEKADTISDN